MEPFVPPPSPSESKLNSPEAKKGYSPFLHLLKLVAIAVVVMVAIFAGVYVAFEMGWRPSFNDSPSRGSSNDSSFSPSVSTSLFGSSVGKNSALFYKSFLDEQVECQAKAAGIRAVVERIDVSPTFPDALGNIYTSPNLGGVQKALKLCAGFYARSVKNRLALSNAGVDPAVISYVDQITAFDQQSQDVYEAYSQDPASKAPRLAIIAGQREAFLRESEPALIAAFEAKHGIRLPARADILAQKQELAKAGSAKFLVDNGPKKIADLLVGVNFTNLLTGRRWVVEQGEFVGGSVTNSTPMVGCIVFEMKMSFKGARSQAPCNTHALIVAAEDPVLNMYWVFHARDAR